ncbi:MAG: hypothetical protein OEZ48_08680 [Candidatus Bathyarchaeota archaeon]|nr:hypothetical protein [Candidatus Bathyarchaeota archaeon]
MSKRSARKSKAISVYLSPKAKEILDRYYQNSGFGSISRTVEELILSYDKIYTTTLSIMAQTGVKEFLTKPGTWMVTFLLMLSNLDLSNGSPFEEIVKRQMEESISGKWSEE